jgi:hypothetical protein
MKQALNNAGPSHCTSAQGTTPSTRLSTTDYVQTTIAWVWGSDCHFSFPSFVPKISFNTRNIIPVRMITVNISLFLDANFGTWCGRYVRSALYASHRRVARRSSLSRTSVGEITNKSSP